MPGIDLFLQIKALRDKGGSYFKMFQIWSCSDINLTHTGRHFPNLFVYRFILSTKLHSPHCQSTLNPFLNIYRIFCPYRAKTDIISRGDVVCGATADEKLVSALQQSIINLSDYSVRFDAAFGIFIVCIIALFVVILVVIVECCLGVYKKASF